MRELLCKAKEKKTNEWIEGYYYRSWGCKNGIMYDVHLIHNYDMDESYEIDINTLCQLTHLKDINGCKVWENDVVKTPNGFMLQVVWSDEFQEFMFKNIKGGCSFIEKKMRVLSAYTRDNKFEVVGNAFYR